MSKFNFLSASIAIAPKKEPTKEADKSTAKEPTKEADKSTTKEPTKEVTVSFKETNKEGLVTGKEPTVSSKDASTGEEQEEETIYEHYRNVKKDIPIIPDKGSRTTKRSKRKEIETKPSSHHPSHYKTKGNRGKESTQRIWYINCYR